MVSGRRRRRRTVAGLRCRRRSVLGWRLRTGTRFGSPAGRLTPALPNMPRMGCSVLHREQRTVRSPYLSCICLLFCGRDSFFPSGSRSVQCHPHDAVSCSHMHTSCCVSFCSVLAELVSPPGIVAPSRTQRGRQWTASRPPPPPPPPPTPPPPPPPPRPPIASPSKDSDGSSSTIGEFGFLAIPGLQSDINFLFLVFVPLRITGRAGTFSHESSL